MSFNYEINDIILLSNENIVFKSEEKKLEFELKQPTIKDFYTNEDLMFFIAFLDKELEEIQDWLTIKIDSHYNFIHLVASLANTNEHFKRISKSLIKGFQALIPKLRFDKTLKVEDVVVTKKLFNQIVEIIYKTMDKKKIIINEDDDEFTKKQKKLKLKAQKIKSKNKKTEGTDIEKIIAAILHEFPQYKINDIMNMNLYTFYYLFKYVGKIANYEVSKIAAGNGLSKKHKYFIEK